MEHMNNTIQNILRTLNSKEKNNWLDYVTEVVKIYNSTPQAATEFTPYFLVHGRES